MTSRTTQICIIGAGTMGSGIAQSAAQAGYQVRVIDLMQSALDKGRAMVEAALRRQETRRKLTAGQRQCILERITWHNDLEVAAKADIVIEAIVERMDIKTALFRDLEQKVLAQCILATNTSSLSVQAIAEKLRHPERFLGLHFFNPVPAMRLVEVIAAPGTAPAMAAKAGSLVESWGKTAISARDEPGFIVNSVARPYYAEAFAALDDGIAPQDIDALMEEAGGFRLGPLALTDMIGQDVNFAAARSVHERQTGIRRFHLQARQAALVEAGKLGDKTGEGVYIAGQRPAPHWLAPSATHPSVIRANTVGSGLQGLVDRLAQLDLAIEHDSTLPKNSLAIGLTIVALCDGRPLSERLDCDALLDWARDYHSAAALGVTGRDDTSIERVAGLLAAARIKTLRLIDRPGLVVMRNLCQLANAAADAVERDVAGKTDIDLAMTLGANHPEGPLAWLARQNDGEVFVGLKNLSVVLGDETYAPAAELAPLVERTE